MCFCTSCLVMSNQNSAVGIVNLLVMLLREQNSETERIEIRKQNPETG